MNLALIGYRGTGKSTIAALLSRQTGWVLQNLDALIEARAGLTIPQIVDQHGWDFFRDLESRILAEVVAGDHQILDCGGGIILREENRRRLKAAATVVWLTAPVAVIIARIEGDHHRPSLTGKSITAEITEVLAEREPLYRACADYIVATDTQTPEQAAGAILRLLGQ